jgi:hypothetical protein
MMRSESEIINALSGSFLGDYPIIINPNDINDAAVKLFLQIMGITSSSSVPNQLFNVSTADDSLVLGNYYAQSYIEPILQKIRNYIDVDLPNRMKKLPAVLDPYTFTDNPEQRAAILKERGRIEELFEYYGVELPVITYSFFGG